MNRMYYGILFLVIALTFSACTDVAAGGNSVSTPSQVTQQTVGIVSGTLNYGWRRIAHITPFALGCSGIFSISGTRGNHVYSHNISWSAGHPGKANAMLLSGGNYSGFQFRIVLNNGADTFLEINLSDTVADTDPTVVMYRVEMFTGTGLEMSPLNALGSVPTTYFQWSGLVPAAAGTGTVLNLVQQ